MLWTTGLSSAEINARSELFDVSIVLAILLTNTAVTFLDVSWACSTAASREARSVIRLIANTPNDIKLPSMPTIKG